MAKLRVGTTGDYPPFSKYNDQLQCFEGFDIELIEAFAKCYTYKVNYIKTIWPELEAELEAENFDIALGGVSLSKEREHKFLFSLPILESKKAVLTHVKNIGKYKSIYDINNSGVSVIYNPGGTNEKFVKQHLSLAEQICESEIEDIFKRLAQRDADIMVTDEQEAIYRSSTIPDLIQISLSDSATQSKFGFIFPRAQLNLQNQLNVWLLSYLQTDEFRALHRRFMK